MKKILLNIIYHFAEKGKMIGKNREKLKAFLCPIYLWICRLMWKFDFLYLYHVEIPITTRCTLKCKKCCFLIPYLPFKKDYDINMVLNSMDALFDCVDRIQVFRILGGETFLYKDIDKIITKAKEAKCVSTIDIVTNGTIVPSNEIFKIMSDSRITLQISDYGELSSKKEIIKEKCDEYGVKCVIRSEENKTWFDAGGVEKRGRTKKELIKQKKKCGTICRNLNEGKLYFCPRQSFGTKIGVPEIYGEYVDVFGGDREENRKKIFSLNQKKFLSTCDYCDEGTDSYVVIPVAEQIREDH